MEKSKENVELKGACIMEEMPVEVSTADAERIGVEPPEVGTILTMDKNAMRITDCSRFSICR